MPALHVRNVDDAVVERLKARARAHNRSLEGEVREILVQASGEAPSGKPEVPLRLRLRTVNVGSPASFGREDIYGDDGR